MLLRVGCEVLRSPAVWRVCAAACLAGSSNASASYSSWRARSRNACSVVGRKSTRESYARLGFDDGLEFFDGDVEFGDLVDGLVGGDAGDVGGDVDVPGDGEGYVSEAVFGNGGDGDVAGAVGSAFFARWVGWVGGAGNRGAVDIEADGGGCFDGGGVPRAGGDGRGRDCPVGVVGDGDIEA